MTDTAVVAAGLSELDRLVSSLEAVSRTVRETRPTDAIDRVLADSRRTTTVVSLREAPEVEAFRQALVDGQIRGDAVNRLLRLVNEVVVALVQ
ncbi:MAG TPA: hypothetical protein PKY77_18755 [Phycisphaerae bacterium]|nr:hypothetical protein [Phycisphaerae bacterium]HRY66380.1 hypothetical protein [Phycisphaerae bacterium]HSA25913.1 hypothetical protein [Phycisphaerae bacterium]